ncbi:MAG: bifunctional diaminohydroxyphosphoribosylaminopyrimidine deaminase/5-amino-6-(5-phosphoribosylamino)uracil reductase RibD [Epsilonproteobacteria bacterium]|nr:bifunctional diaminohydroxyphosphoribosylaminopyrimidine deaminase/5-amino-6-(5-phosphoribosylamino)uracil reductase RibD [Campylobacterota bacterium]
MSEEFFMELAFKEAFKYMLLTYPNPSVGAVVVRDGAILAIEAHRKAGESHAEVLALVRVYESLSGKEINFNRFDANLAHKFILSNKEIFRGCELYITLEPCSHIGKTPSCAMLLKDLPLKRVIIGALDPISSHSGGVEILKSKNIEVEVGILKDRCEILIEPFTIWQKRSFVLFKLAQSTNGQIGCGYISSKGSLEYVHKIRELSTKLLIGGNTIRVDRPKLDSRFSGGRAPDIYIYSKEDNFDREIPLFKVKGREVEIGDDLSFLNKKGLVLVEGGEGMLKALKKYIDWLLIFQAPKLMANCLSYNIDMRLEFLEVSKRDDILIWSRVLG